MKLKEDQTKNIRSESLDLSLVLFLWSLPVGVWSYFCESFLCGAGLTSVGHSCVGLVLLLWVIPVWGWSYFCALFLCWAGLMSVGLSCVGLSYYCLLYTSDAADER